jgi:hypothetical protein
MVPGNLASATRSPARAGRSALLALAVAAALTAACGSPEAPARLDPSDGLVVVLPRGEEGSDLAGVRIADGAAVLLTDRPDTSKGSPLWLDAVQRLLFTEPIPGESPPRIRMMLLDPRTGLIRGATDQAGDLEIQPATTDAGRQVVYVFAGVTRGGYAQGVKRLRVMDAQDKILSTSPRDGVLRFPRISPDGLSVVVEVQRPTSGTDLWLLRDEVPVVKLVEGRLHDDTSPRFSRAGGVVYFDRKAWGGGRRAAAASRLGGGDVCSVHVDTLEVSCSWASEDAREYAVEPSPARDELLFLREKEGRVELVLADAQAQGSRSLLAPSGANPRNLVWSPSGERIAFVSGPERAATVTVVDRDGTVLLETPGEAVGWAPPPTPEP